MYARFRGLRAILAACATGTPDASETPMRARTSATVDQYLLRERVAAGGMGVVWRADQRALVRQVPVQIVDPDLAVLPDLLTRLCRSQGSASAAIAFGIGWARSLVVMEHVDGTTLAETLRTEVQVAVPRAVDVVTQVLRALQEAHAAGIVHADLRPEHVIIERRPGGRELVTLVEVGGPADDAWVGAPAHLAPEILAGGRPTIASDLYAVGVILYQLLTGRPPFDGDSLLETMTRQLRGTVTPPTLRRRDLEIPPGVERATLRALARSPAARFADAATFAAELGAAMRAPHVDRLRAAVRQALERGAATELADRYLDLALAIAHRDGRAAAIAELDAAIELFLWDERVSSPDGPHLLARLRTAVARLR
jgi:serine/threonine-protein kinase